MTPETSGFWADVISGGLLFVGVVVVGLRGLVALLPASWTGSE